MARREGTVRVDQPGRESLGERSVRVPVAVPVSFEVRAVGATWRAKAVYGGPAIVVTASTRALALAGAEDAVARALGRLLRVA